MYQSLNISSFVRNIIFAVAVLGGAFFMLAEDAGASGYECKGHPATFVMDPDGGVLIAPEGAIFFASGSLLEATEGDDVIVGTSGNDRIFGNGGDDIICGGKGDDFIVGNRGADRIYGGGGDDELYAFFIPAGYYDDTTTKADILVGGNGDDKLIGSGDRDIFRAGKGNDTIEGNDGGDRYNGGKGEDKCDEFFSPFLTPEQIEIQVNTFTGKDVVRGCESTGPGFEVFK